MMSTAMQFISLIDFFLNTIFLHLNNHNLLDSYLSKKFHFFSTRISKFILCYMELQITIMNMNTGEQILIFKNQ